MVWLVELKPSDLLVVVTPKFSWLVEFKPSDRLVVVIPKFVWDVDVRPVLLSVQVVTPKLVWQFVCAEAVVARAAAANAAKSGILIEAPSD